MRTLWMDTGLARLCVHNYINIVLNDRTPENGSSLVCLGVNYLCRNCNNNKPDIQTRKFVASSFATAGAPFRFFFKNALTSYHRPIFTATVFFFFLLFISLDYFLAQFSTPDHASLLQHNFFGSSYHLLFVSFIICDVYSVLGLSLPTWVTLQNIPEKIPN